MGYVKVDNYAMKCRLYPNKEQAESLDRAFYAIHLCVNKMIYNMFNYYDNCNEFIGKDDGNKLHFVDVNKFFKADYLENLRQSDDRICDVYAGSISTNAGGVKEDLKRMLLTCESKKEKAQRMSEKGKLKSEKTHRKVGAVDLKNGKIKAIETLIPNYYVKGKKERTSFSFQFTVKNVSCKGNHNVLYMHFPKNTMSQRNPMNFDVKVRGWNQNIRFGENADLDFLEWCNDPANKSKKITVCVSKNSAGEYYVIFKFNESCLCNIPCKKPTGKECGVDVGIKDIMILSDGNKYENKKYKRANKKRLKALQKRLSRSYGWANEKFRNEHKKNPLVNPSRRYEKLNAKIAKLHNKISNKTSTYNNNITADVISNNDYIAVESLNVKGMFRNHHLAFALSEACMGDILSKLKYKSEWRGKKIVEIGRYDPSTKRCSNCGETLKKISLGTREWTCKKCGTHHDRDVNAAKNILYYSKIKQLNA